MIRNDVTNRREGFELAGMTFISTSIRLRPQLPLTAAMRESSSTIQGESLDGCEDNRSVFVV